jgi:hypothetical protein
MFKDGFILQQVRLVSSKFDIPVSLIVIILMPLEQNLVAGELK